ncbi:MAG TPA: MG2 domain-containing protein, partial [Pseudobdellovibrionaceae bacterium]|nr:MG2 domain-containing protein [Pseudobdellovibrionaceae bacterium]
NEDEGKKFQIPKPLSERELELVGIPLKKPGFYVVEMTSPKLGKALTDGGPMYVSTAALVTDMAVHFKNGRESSLVWVSQLSDAKPVSDAQISIVNARGREIASGKTNSDGTLLLNDLEDPCENRDEFRGEFDEQDYHINRCEIFVFAKKGDDFSFVSSTWSKGIEYFRFNLPSEYLNQTWGPSVMHSILDRMLAQPGDSIQMKHLLRDHTGSGFKMMSSERIPKRVLIVHQASQKTYTLPFEYDPKTGTATSKFIIPKDATLGRYSIYLSNKLELKKTNSDENDPFDWTAKESGHFVVSEYRIPLMRAAVQIQGEPLVRPSEVAADLSASYLSGGPARGLKVKLRATVQPGYFEPDIPDKSDYQFFADPIKVGLINEEDSTAPEEKFLKVQALTLNNDGGLLAKIGDLPKIKTIQQLVVEMEYSDPNGEIKTTSKQVPLYPAENIIGLRTENWFVDPSKIKVFGVITNNLGKPQPQTSYAVEAFRNTYYSHRKRLVGGFYSYDSKVEVTSLGKVCEGQSDEFGRFTCAPNGLPAGSLVLQAKTTDKKGFTTYSSIHVSAYSSGVDDWWTPSDSD